LLQCISRHVFFLLGKTNGLRNKISGF
jgi:hypothetical protein